MVMFGGLCRIFCIGELVRISYIFEKDLIIKKCTRIYIFFNYLLHLVSYNPQPLDRPTDVFREIFTVSLPKECASLHKPPLSTRPKI